VLQLIMVAAIIAVPTLVTGGIEKTVQIDADKALEQLQMKSRESLPSATGAPSGDAASAPAGAATEKEDPMKGLLESMSKDQPKK
jgi:hypothetical protein